MEFTLKELRGYVITGVVKSGGYGQVADAAAQAFDAMVADAQRFAGLRLILCEQDRDAQERIIEALDKFMESQPEFDTGKVATPERFNELADAMILVAAQARVV